MRLKNPQKVHERAEISNNSGMNFWARVDEEREFRNMERKQLAEAAGFNVSNISKGIKENNVPAADTAVRIAALLGVTVEYLVTGKAAPAPDAEFTAALEQFRSYRRFLANFAALPQNAQDGIQALVRCLQKGADAGGVVGGNIHGGG